MENLVGKSPGPRDFDVKTAAPADFDVKTADQNASSKKIATRCARRGWRWSSVRTSGGADVPFKRPHHRVHESPTARLVTRRQQ